MQAGSHGTQQFIFLHDKIWNPFGFTTTENATVFDIYGRTEVLLYHARPQISMYFIQLFAKLFVMDSPEELTKVFKSRIEKIPITFILQKGIQSISIHRINIYATKLFGRLIPFLTRLFTTFLIPVSFLTSK